LGYSAFRLPSRMPSPALLGPLVISRCSIDRSAAYLGRFLGVLPTTYSRPSSPDPASWAGATSSTLFFGTLL
jgi:hypothetical protein